jgi:hypothetical protein
MKGLNEENRRNITVGWGSVHSIRVLLSLHVPSIELLIPSRTGDSNVSLAIGISIRVMHLIPLVPHSPRGSKTLIHQLLVTLTSEVQFLDEGHIRFLVFDLWDENPVVQTLLDAVDDQFHCRKHHTATVP